MRRKCRRRFTVYGPAFLRPGCATSHLLPNIQQIPDALHRPPLTRVVPSRQERIAIAARARFPLNFGDCFAYAHARLRKEPLITLDDDFLATDLEAVWHPRPRSGASDEPKARPKDEAAPHETKARPVKQTPPTKQSTPTKHGRRR